jgi:hypothetical protein
MVYTIYIRMAFNEFSVLVFYDDYVYLYTFTFKDGVVKVTVKDEHDQLLIHSYQFPDILLAKKWFMTWIMSDQVIVTDDDWQVHSAHEISNWTWDFIFNTSQGKDPKQWNGGRCVKETVLLSRESHLLKYFGSLIFIRRNNKRGITFLASKGDLYMH